MPSRYPLALLTMSAFTLLACDSSRTPTESAVQRTSRVSVALEDRFGGAVALSPRSATLLENFGLLLQARITDQSGSVLSGARASWRSTNLAVATVTSMPDSGRADDINRVRVNAHATGTALVIASYNDVADTTTITVVPRPDSAGGTNAPRVAQFDLAVRILGATTRTPSTPTDTATYTLQPVPGSTVTLTLLPLAPGETVAAGVRTVTAPELYATLTTDATGTVRFTNVPGTRYRVAVQPPAGSAWTSLTQDAPPPYASTLAWQLQLRR